MNAVYPIEGAASRHALCRLCTGLANSSWTVRDVATGNQYTPWYWDKVHDEKTSGSAVTAHAIKKEVGNTAATQAVSSAESAQPKALDADEAAGMDKTAACAIEPIGAQRRWVWFSARRREWRELALQAQ